MAQAAEPASSHRASGQLDYGACEQGRQAAARVDGPRVRRRPPGQRVADERERANRGRRDREVPGSASSHGAGRGVLHLLGADAARRDAEAAALPPPPARWLCHGGAPRGPFVPAVPVQHRGRPGRRRWPSGGERVRRWRRLDSGGERLPRRHRGRRGRLHGGRRELQRQRGGGHRRRVVIGGGGVVRRFDQSAIVGEQRRSGLSPRWR
mmetsp:Transcript_12203/g.33078  ORF Transcript_12203/g.33078 Transcript_12203/m.33078 type:complete len:209 (-) Transcript_12203:262-888(-)